ncbi:hypothetical protein EON65_37805 [archaeon]|nr:MAG: hypothetical protein EON65_37805 [archaeon]
MSREKAYYKDIFLPCFFVDSKDWKRNVVRRGTLVFQQVWDMCMRACVMCICMYVSLREVQGLRCLF